MVKCRRVLAKFEQLVKQMNCFRANQHSCGDENNNCQVVIQYMCDENLRDGTTTDHAPVTCKNDCDTNKQYGHHESLNYYENCNVRERNQGIFIADRVGNSEYSKDVSKSEYDNGSNNV